MPADSLGTARDSLGVAMDSLKVAADSLKSATDSLKSATDSLLVSMDKLEELQPTDSLSGEVPPSDSLSTVTAPKDSTKIGFVWGVSHVKLYRDDMQMACDSLHYSDLDSLVRLYKDPVFYNEGNRQYAADSIYVVIHNRRPEKANLMANAFITIQEDSLSFDQIRGTEMVAYFDSTAALTRFDALGGANALFFLVENNALATVNKVESKMLYATFKDSELERIYYFEEPKNDGYPVVQMLKEDKQLKGFRWEPERRPRNRYDITSLEPRVSQRLSYLARPHAEFKETNRYFPGYINKIYKEIAYRDSMEVVHSRERARARAVADSLAAITDTLSIPEDSIALKDSLGRVLDVMDTPADTLSAPVDSLKSPADSLGTSPADTLAPPKVLTPQEQKALEKQRKEEERARKKAEKQAAREARWAEEDRRYEEKQAAKAERKLARERAKKLRELRRLEKKEQKERAIYEKYLERERRRALKKLEKK